MCRVAAATLQDKNENKKSDRGWKDPDASPTTLLDRKTLLEQQPCFWVFGERVFIFFD